jgi:hypothetical protein
MSEHKVKKVATGPADAEKEVIRLFSSDAKKLVAAYTRDVKLCASPDVRRSAFAAFEATRNNITARMYDLSYVSFVLLSVVAALIISFAVPRELRSLAWDAWGLGSTLLLLVLTYGIYVLLRFCHEVQRAIRPGQVPVKDQDTTVGHVILFALGMVATWNAVSRLNYIFHEKMLQDAANAVTCNKSYAWFVFCVGCLALLFVVMDFWVAVNDDSHNETFIAASSFIHSTLPMAIGILVIGLYMVCDYISLLHQGKNSSEAFAQLPVEFVSGALSFQMIMSNTLFAFIKRNLFLRFAYFATGSTKSL